LVYGLICLAVVSYVSCSCVSSGSLGEERGRWSLGVGALPLSWGGAGAEAAFAQERCRRDVRREEAGKPVQSGGPGR
jgi:hypothetical protein